MAGDPILPQPFVVTANHTETDDVFTLELEGEQPLPFAPGQFTMLYGFGCGEVPISISGDPDHPQQLVQTIRRVGPVTRSLGQLQPGDSLGVRGPYGQGWPLEQAHGKDIVILAGGVGLPPLRPLLYQLIRQRDDYGRINLLYGTRSPGDILFADQLAQWRQLDEVVVEITVDRSIPGWQGHSGVVTTLLPHAAFEAANTVAFLCGPEVMMRFGAQTLIGQGISPEHIFISMERNMKCAIGLCGHCQFGPDFICKDGPVFAWHHVEKRLWIREL